LAVHLTGHPNVGLLIELVVFLDIRESSPAALDDHIDAVGCKPVGLHPGLAGAATDESGDPVALDGILVHDDLAVLDEHDPVALVLADGVVFEVDHRGHAQHAVVVAVDVVLGH